MSRARRRLIAYSVILVLGALLVWYGVSPIHPSRHGFNELFAIMLGGIMGLVGVAGVVIVGLGALFARPE
ncbi:MAG TPA: hypothetical protein VGM90_19770 [Kofleriaceae bacterium]|jgi:type IV secretory pathway VirB2 component (pilin)